MGAGRTRDAAARETSARPRAEVADFEGVPARIRGIGSYRVALLFSNNFVKIFEIPVTSNL